MAQWRAQRSSVRRPGVSGATNAVLQRGVPEPEPVAAVAAATSASTNTTAAAAYSWFHADAASREAAEARLTAARAEGSFLVRASASHPGDYVLSVRSAGRCAHYHIRSGPDGSVQLDGFSQRFASLPLLVRGVGWLFFLILRVNPVLARWGTCR